MGVPSHLPHHGCPTPPGRVCSPRAQATFNQAVFQAAMEENAEEDVHVEVADMTEIDNSEVRHAPTYYHIHAGQACCNRCCR